MSEDGGVAHSIRTLLQSVLEMSERQKAETRKKKQAKNTQKHIQ